MASIDFGSFFGGNSSNNNTGLSGMLSDYSSIKNGSYGKLMKAYYKSDASKTDEEKAAAVNPDKELKNYKTTKEDSTSLIKALDELQKKGDDSLFKQTVKKNDDGTETKEYDVDAIYSAVKKFADSYNDLIKSAGASDSTSVLVPASSMTGLTAKTMSTLGSVGISVGKDNSLSIDEDYFKKSANMTTVKSLFNSIGGYGYEVSAQGSQIRRASQSALNSKGTYDRAAKVSTKDIVNGFDSMI